MNDLEQSVGEASAPATIVSSVSSITLWGLSASDLSVIVSAAVAVLTFSVYMWYTLRKDRRAEELHARQLQELDNEEADEGAGRKDG